MGSPDAELPFEAALRASCERAGVVGVCLVAAVSGGPDSLALLHALHRLRGALSLELHAAHLNHGLRGAASAADAEFVARTCAALGVALHGESVDALRFRRERRLSLEDAARRLRHGFFSRVSERVGARAVALGHTADDQVETVLMRVIRGSGMRGLRGMREMSTIEVEGAPLSLFRPMLRLSKRDALDYCDARKLRPRFDETNDSPAMTRNRVRRELLPLLRELNPSVGDSVLRMAGNANDAVEILDGAVEGVWASVVEERGGGARFDRQAFRALPAGLRSHLMASALARFKPDEAEIGHAHVRAAVDAIAGAAGRYLTLPGGLRFVVEQDFAHLGIGEVASAELAPAPAPTPLAAPGETVAGVWKVRVQRVARPPRGWPAAGGRAGGEGFLELFGRGVDASTLATRHRRPGDRFQPLGMREGKKLKSFMVDARIPRGERASVPLVVTSRGIAWVVGRRIADWAKVGADDAERLEIRFERLS